MDLVDLQRAPEGLAGRIALAGAVVLDDDPVRRVRWQADTRTRYLDEAPSREAVENLAVGAPEASTAVIVKVQVARSASSRAS